MAFIKGCLEYNHSEKLTAKILAGAFQEAIKRNHERLRKIQRRQMYQDDHVSHFLAYNSTADADDSKMFVSEEVLN